MGWGNKFPDMKNDPSYLEGRLSNAETQLAQKVNLTDVQNMSKGSPSGVYATLSALQTAFPTGNSNIYVVTADGKWYYWNGSAWTAGGVYQSTGIANGSITIEKLNPDFSRVDLSPNFFTTSLWEQGSSSGTIGNTYATNKTSTANVIRMINTQLVSGKIMITVPSNYSYVIQTYNTDTGLCESNSGWLNSTNIYDFTIPKKIILLICNNPAGTAITSSIISTYTGTISNVFQLPTLDQRLTDVNNSLNSLTGEDLTTTLFISSLWEQGSLSNLSNKTYTENKITTANVIRMTTSYRAIGRLVITPSSPYQFAVHEYDPNTGLFIKNSAWLSAKTTFDYTQETDIYIIICSVTAGKAVSPSAIDTFTGTVSRKLTSLFLKDNIDQLSDDVIVLQNKGITDLTSTLFSATLWEQGSLVDTGNTYALRKGTSPNVIRTIDPQLVNGRITITIPSNYQMQVQIYNAKTGIYESTTGWKISSIVLDFYDEKQIGLLIASYPSGTAITTAILTGFTGTIKNEFTSDYFKTKTDTDSDSINSLPTNSQLLIIGRTTKMKNLAHRGYSSIAPENTMPAFQKAAENGFWGIETDVHSTSDGHFVLIHDDTVDRTTNGTGTVANMTLDQIRALTVDTGANINLYPNTVVPTVEETLIFCKKNNLTCMMEWKNISDNQAFIDTIRNYGMESKCILEVPDFNLINTLRGISKNIPIMYLPPGSPDETTLMSNIDTISTVWNNAGIGIYYPSLTENLVHYANSKGVFISTFTLDDSTIADTFKDYGVDIIMTDSILLNWQ